MKFGQSDNRLFSGMRRIGQSLAVGCRKLTRPLAVAGSFAGRIFRPPQRFLRNNPIAWAALLLSVLPLNDSVPIARTYDHAYQLLTHGKLAQSQQEAKWGYRQFLNMDSLWADRFLLLEAEVAQRRGLDAEAQPLVAAFSHAAEDPNQAIHAHIVQANVSLHQFDLVQAKKEIFSAERLCRQTDYPACGSVLLTHAQLALRQVNFDEAQKFCAEAYRYAQAHGDLFLQRRAALKMGDIAFNAEQFDVSQEWSRQAYRAAMEQGDEDTAMNAEGNMAMASFPYGDTRAARDLFLHAAQTAERLGNLRSEYRWTLSAADTDTMSFHFAEAVRSLRMSLAVAQKMQDKNAVWYSHLELADVLVWSGYPQEAQDHFKQAEALTPSGEFFLQLYLDFVRGQIAGATHRDGEAEAIFRSVLQRATPLETWRFEAVSELAAALERQGRTREAEQTCRDWLAIFEAERVEKTGVTARMTYLTWGVNLYSRYIGMLMRQGRTEEALEWAERSRARSNMQSLGDKLEKISPRQQVLHPRQIARKSGATVLYYWMSYDGGYLWTITPEKIHASKLPSEIELMDRIENYRTALSHMEDTQATGNPDGKALYAAFVAPAAPLLHPNQQVILIVDSELSTLSFDALLAPGKAPGEPAGTGSHYWVEDVVLRSAPSLSALAASKSPPKSTGRMLLMGNAVAASPDYAELPMAPLEMQLIEKHFPATARTVFTRSQATPAAYLNSSPEQYAYIHFVTHGIASRFDPMDSTILLSPSEGSEGSYKLYAREIVRHPIDARLVTISACYSSGARVFVGEGLVGLSWAFLHAGAQNVIGALWEVSDESSPRLMDSLYEGLQQGQSPDRALRQAKLALLHSSTTNFHAPFYWAAFQDYSRQ